MENIDAAVNNHRKAGVRRMIKHHLKIDMTPMVDLGFLLITFFVFTTTIATPSVTDLFMPDDQNIIDSSNLSERLALTVLLTDHNKIYYYYGNWKEAEKDGKIFETGYSVYNGLGNIIRKKQRVIDESGKFPDGRKGLMLLIKPTSQAAYRNVVDVVDEILINDVRKYAIIEPGKSEVGWINIRKN